MDDFDPDALAVATLGEGEANQPAPEPYRGTPADRLAEATLEAPEEPSEQQQKLRHAVGYYREHADEFWGKTSYPYIAERVPVAGALEAVDYYRKLHSAAKGFEEGKPSDDDLYTVAQHLAKQQYESQRSFGRKTFDLATQVPGMAAEWVASGGVGGAARVGAEKAVAGVVAKYLGEGLASKLATGAVKYAAEGVARSALMPSTYANIAAQSVGQDQEGMPEAKGIPEAVFRGGVQSAVQNTIFAASGAFAPKEAGPWLSDTLKSTAKAVGGMQLGKEVLYRVALSERPSEAWQVLAGPDRAKALQELGPELVVFGGLEGFMHAVPKIRARYDELRSRGLAPGSEKMRDALSDFTETLAAQAYHPEGMEPETPVGRPLPRVAEAPRTAPEPAPAPTPSEVPPESPAGQPEAPPATARQQADALEKQHLDTLRQLEDARRKERAAKDMVGKGFAQAGELKTARKQRISLQRALEGLEENLDAARIRAGQEDAANQPPPREDVPPNGVSAPTEAPVLPDRLGRMRQRQQELGEGVPRPAPMTKLREGPRAAAEEILGKASEPLEPITDAERAADAATERFRYEDLPEKVRGAVEEHVAGRYADDPQAAGQRRETARVIYADAQAHGESGAAHVKEWLDIANRPKPTARATWLPLLPAEAKMAHELGISPHDPRTPEFLNDLTDFAVARAARRLGREPASLRRELERDLQAPAAPAAADAAAEAAAPGQGGPEAGPAPARGRKTPGDKLKPGEALANWKAQQPVSLLSVVKKMGGLSKESVHSHGFDVKALEEAIPSIFKGRTTSEKVKEIVNGEEKTRTTKRTPKGTGELTEMAEQIIGEGHLPPPPEGVPLHEYLIEKLEQHAESMAGGVEHHLRVEQEAYERELADAQRLGGTDARAAEAARAGQADSDSPEGARSVEEILRGDEGGAGEDAGEEGGPGAPEEVAPGVHFFHGPGGPGGQAPGQPPVPPTPARRPGLADDVKRLLAPASRGEHAQVGAGVLRENLAKMARSKEIAREQLKAAERHFDETVLGAPDDATKTERFLQFTDAIEGGEIKGLPDELRPLAETVRALVDERSEAVARRGLVSHFIENYLGHLWQKPGSNLPPEEVGKILGGRRPLAGREGFKKQRTLPTYRDGIEAGLEPVDWNPARLVLRTLEQVDKSVMAHDVREELTAQGLRKYVPVGTKAPEGWAKTSDKGDVNFAPPEVKVKEFFDKQQMEGLEKFAADLGIDVKRVLTGLGTAAGKAEPGKVTTRFGTPEEVLAHEIGHELDRRYQLGNTVLRAPGPIRGELEALADLRASGQVSPEYQAYLRSAPEKMANLVAAYLHAPELARQVAPQAVEWFDRFLQSKGELRPLREIKPSLELGEREQWMRLAGPVLAGHWYFPEPVVRLLDNYATPGFRGNKVYDIAREFGNLQNQFQLGFGAFHAGFVAMDTVVSATALGLQKISRGRVAEGLKDIARAPVAPVRAWLEGSKVLREYYAPGSQGAEMAALLRSFEEAGGRAKMDEFYGGTYLEGLRTTLREFRQGKGSAKGVGSVLYQALPALSELVSKPVMEHLVPRMKMGVFADLARFEMERLGPDADPNTRRAALGKAWDSVENRLGQLTYDNLFWNRTFKDLMMASVRSVGWNTGTIRELGGGLADLPASYRGLREGQGITSRTAYIAGLALTTGFFGAVYQYLATGKGPDELKDLYFPKNGRTRKDGTPDRVSLPSYVRDVAALTNRSDEGPLRLMQNAGTMAKHKVNPGLSTAYEMLFNEDFYGGAIRNPNDSATRQSWDTAIHLAKSFEPFTTRSFRQQTGKGLSPGEAALGLVGITPAPSYVVHTSEQQRQGEVKRKYQLSPLEKKRRGLR